MNEHLASCYSWGTASWSIQFSASSRWCVTL